MGVGTGRTAYHDLTFHTSRLGSTVNISVHAFPVYDPDYGDSYYIATLKKYDTRTGAWYTIGSLSGTLPGSIDSQSHKSFTGISTKSHERLYVDFDYYAIVPNYGRNHIGTSRVPV